MSHLASQRRSPAASSTRWETGCSTSGRKWRERRTRGSEYTQQQRHRWGGTSQQQQGATDGQGPSATAAWRFGVSANRWHIDSDGLQQGRPAIQHCGPHHTPAAAKCFSAVVDGSRLRVCAAPPMPAGSAMAPRLTCWTMACPPSARAGRLALVCWTWTLQEITGPAPRCAGTVST